MTHTVDIDLFGKTITFETGRMAKQANGAVIVKTGDNVVLVTACSNEEPKQNASFFPLTVDYREYTYAAGRFPGGFIKREGRPSEKEILTSRMIDRPIRPLFPEGYLNETQIIGMVLSADPLHDPSSLAIMGAAASLAISDIPFEYVLGAVRVALVGGKMIAEPSYDELREAEFTIVVTGTEHGIVMVEAGGSGVTEEKVVDAIEFGHECCRKIIAGIRELVTKAGKPKRDLHAARDRPPAVRQNLYRSSRQPLGRDEHREVQEDRQLSPCRRIEEERRRSGGRRNAFARNELFRPFEGRSLPRRDAEQTQASGWPQV